jgi:hypothetical protein
MTTWTPVCGRRTRGWLLFSATEASFYNSRYILSGAVETACTTGMGIEGVAGACVLGWEAIDTIIGRHCNINSKMVEARLPWKNGDFKPQIHCKA